VKLYVGQGNEVVSIHRNLLSQQSFIFDHVLKLQDEGEDIVPFLQQKLHSSVKANFGDKSIILPHPEYEVESLSAVFDWLYAGTLPAGAPFGNLFRVYKLASAFEMPQLLNEIMDEFQTRYRDTKSLWRVSDIETVFRQRGLGEGKLWYLCLTYIAGKISWGTVKDKWASQFKRFCFDNPLVYSHLLDVQLQDGARIHTTLNQCRKPLKPVPFEAEHFHVPLKPAPPVGTKSEFKSRHMKKDKGENEDIDPLRGVQGARVNKTGGKAKKQRDRSAALGGGIKSESE
jgi:hypothetical protein